MNRRTLPLTTATLLIAGSAILAARGADLLQPDDARGKELRAAAKQFLIDLADGKEKEVRSQFAGGKDAAKLLDLQIKAVALSQELRSALSAKFGKDASIPFVGVDVDLRSHIDGLVENSVAIIDGEDGSISPGPTAFMAGLELKMVEKKWKVSYTMSIHDKFEKKVTAYLEAAIDVMPSIAKRVKEGKFADLAAAEDALIAEFNKKTGRKGEMAADDCPVLSWMSMPSTEPATTQHNETN